MPSVSVNGVQLYYEETGSGPPVLFSHGLLWSGRMFAAQVEALAPRYRCISYDHRGQGRSEVPPGDEMSIEDCAEDAAALIEALDAGPCHFVGLSMGGFVALRLALRRPELVRSITLVESAADPEPVENHRKYGLMNLVARLGGIRLLTGRVMPIMFGRTFLADPGRAALRERWTAELVSNRRTIYRAVNGVIRREGVDDEALGTITTPTLVLHGEEDVAVKMERAERTAAAIPGARLVRIPRAGHSSSVEEPEAVNAALLDFLGAVGSAAQR